MLDPATRQVTVGGVPVHLTRTEYALCHLLLQNPGRVLSKSAILERISRDTPDCREVTRWVKRYIDRYTDKRFKSLEILEVMDS